MMTERQNIRIRFFADTHLGFDYPIRPRISRRRRGYDFFDNFHRVLDGAAAARVDLLIHGGDLFFRSRVPPRIVDMSYEALIEFAHKGIPVVIVPGNHERSRLPTSLFLAHPNIFVFAAPMTYEFKVRGARICVSGFPFQKGNIRSHFPSVLNETGWDKTNGDIRLLCIHQAVEGAQVGPANFTFRNGQDVIRFDDFPDKFHAVLAGHIHRRQILQGKPNEAEGPVRVIYSGSTERTSFAEKDEPKGFFDLTFASTEEGGWRLDGLDFSQLPARPMIDLELQQDVSNKSLESWLLTQIAKIDENAIVRIRSAGPVNEAIRTKMTSGFLREIFPQSMNVQLGSEFRPYVRKDR